MEYYKSGGKFWIAAGKGETPPEKVAVVFFNYSVGKRQKPEKPRPQICSIGFSGFICFVYKKSKIFEKNSGKQLTFVKSGVIIIKRVDETSKQLNAEVSELADEQD